MGGLQDHKRQGASFIGAEVPGWVGMAAAAAGGRGSAPRHAKARIACCAGKHVMWVCRSSSGSARPQRPAPTASAGGLASRSASAAPAVPAAKHPSAALADRISTAPPAFSGQISAGNTGRRTCSCCWLRQAPARQGVALHSLGSRPIHGMQQLLRLFEPVRQPTHRQSAAGASAAGQPSLAMD